MCNESALESLDIVSMPVPRNPFAVKWNSTTPICDKCSHNISLHELNIRLFYSILFFCTRALQRANIISAAQYYTYVCVHCGRFIRSDISLGYDLDYVAFGAIDVSFCSYNYPTKYADYRLANFWHKLFDFFERLKGRMFAQGSDTSSSRKRMRGKMQRIVNVNLFHSISSAKGDFLEVLVDTL